MSLYASHCVVPVASDMDVSGSATNPADSINMKDVHEVTFLVNFQDLGGAALYCKVYSGATAAALTSALTFRYAFMSAAATAANADVPAADWQTSSNLSIAHATYDNFMLVIEVDASDMDIANGEEWLTISFPDTDTGATGNLSCAAIVKPRFNKFPNESFLD